MMLINKRSGLYLVAAISSAIYILAFPPFYIPILGVLSIIAMSHAFLAIKKIKDLIFISLLVSLGISVFGVYWIIYASQYTFDSIILGILVLVGFSILYSSFIFIVSVPLFINKVRGIFKFIVLVVSWTTSDVAKYYILGGFPWFNSSYLWLFSDKIIQGVSVFGVTGLSFLTYILIFAIYGLFCKRIGLHIRLILLFLAVMFFILIAYFGGQRFEKFDLIESEKTIKLKFVQTNIHQSEKMDLRNLMFYQNKILEQAFIQDDYKPDIYLIPEASFIFFDDNDLDLVTKNLPSDSSLVTGAIRVDEGKFYNSTFVFEGDSKKVTGIYDKIRLVLFGEKIPFSESLQDILHTLGLSDFSAGDEKKILKAGNHLFLPLICFEGLFPINKDLTSVDFILNLANEAWFNQAIEIPQNWQIFRLRAIETGMPVVKISNTGQSGVFDGIGREILSIPPFKKHNSNFNLEIKRIDTTFTKINYHILNLLLTLCYIVMFIILAFNKINLWLKK